MFLALDALRRQRGRVWDAMGLGPKETAYRIVAEQAGMRLRAYVGDASEPHGPAVLIIPAPFKRSYIWDIRPEVSVVRRCQEGGLAVFILEWCEPGPGEDLGLAEFAEKAPLAAVRAVAKMTGGAPIAVAGHSLGGTFAAIFAALHPERVRDLWLIDAPLVFEHDSGDRLAAALRRTDLGWLAAAAGEPVPGSFVSALAVAALPDEFLWGPAIDFLASGWDAELQGIRAQVLRWTQDEFPLPKRLFIEVAEHLYRENRFARGCLPIPPRKVGLGDLRTPVAVVLNPTSAVVPTSAITHGLRLARPASVSFFSCEPNPGCGLPHVMPLVSPSAHARIWPRLVARAQALASQ